eukprot:1158274-Pelagomonas_calceolata.AAC.4
MRPRPQRPAMLSSVLALTQQCPLCSLSQDRAQEIFFAKHANERKERWVSGNFVYFIMERITDIYFVHGRVGVASMLRKGGNDVSFGNESALKWWLNTVRRSKMH